MCIYINTVYNCFLIDCWTLKLKKKTLLSVFVDPLPFMEAATSLWILQTRNLGFQYRRQDEQHGQSAHKAAKWWPENTGHGNTPWLTGKTWKTTPSTTCLGRCFQEWWCLRHSSCTRSFVQTCDASAVLLQFEVSEHPWQLVSNG